MDAIGGKHDSVRGPSAAEKPLMAAVRKGLPHDGDVVLQVPRGSEIEDSSPSGFAVRCPPQGHRLRAPATSEDTQPCRLAHPTSQALVALAGSRSCLRSPFDGIDEDSVATRTCGMDAALKPSLSKPMVPTSLPEQRLVSPDTEGTTQCGGLTADCPL
jgi:hypothetical protein